MQRSVPLKSAMVGLSLLLVAGCANSTPRPDAATAPVQPPPANSPLAPCVDPTPTMPKPVDSPLAQHFQDARVRTAFSLDGGAFRAAPAPSDARPAIGAPLAFCNLLAGATATNSHVIDVATAHGMSFGLAVVTVADSVLRTGPRSYLVGGREQDASLPPYRARLAWIAVTESDVVSACPAMPATSAARPTAVPKRLPAYQILAVDAGTGADGIVYSARTNASCGQDGYQPARVAPAAEFVSLPWTLVSRGPGPQSATISYRPRPCDQQDDLGTFADTGRPAVWADRDHSGLVKAELERVLESCGPATPTDVLLRSPTLTTDLPEHLVHAPIGAEDG